MQVPSTSAIAMSATCRPKNATSRWCSRTTRSTRISPSPRTSASPCESRRCGRPNASSESRKSRSCSASRSTSSASLASCRVDSASASRWAGRSCACPSVFLMDEPLSNLDAKLRVQMRADIAALQSDFGITTVYVTHDQSEAMTLGHRVAVLDEGHLQQCGPPRELYERPTNVFVAGFIGSPAMNLCTVPVTTARRPSAEWRCRSRRASPPTGGRVS